MIKAGSKEIAGPGRRGGIRRKAFQVDKQYLRKTPEVGKLLADLRKEKARKRGSMPQGEDLSLLDFHRIGGMLPPAYLAATSSSFPDLPKRPFPAFEGEMRLLPSPIFSRKNSYS